MTEKIKLLFDATVLASGATKNSNRSGIYFTAYQIVRRLMEKEDIELSFYCAPHAQYLLKSMQEFKKIPLYPKATIFELMLTKSRHSKIQGKIENNTLKKVFWHYLLLVEKMLFKIPHKLAKKHCKQASPDATSVFLPVCPGAEKLLDKKVNEYIMLYDTIPLKLPEYYPEVRKGTAWFLSVVDALKQNPDIRGFAISEQTKRDFLELVPQFKPEQITVVPLACADTFHPCKREETIQSLKKYHLPTDKKYIFALCSLEPRKNLIRSVKTFVEFIKKNKIDDMVFISGGGHWEEFIGKLDAEIANLGDFKDKIIKAGYIDDEDLAPLYSGAEWFVYTSQYEGFGLPPLEAMACGCPVITSNNSSLPEVVSDAGIMIDWDSDEQHIKAYEDYYFHPELREQNRQKGLARAKEFSWDKTVDLIVKGIKK